MANRASVCFSYPRRSISSHSSVAKKRSAIALSYALPTVPLLGRTPISAQRLPSPTLVYWLPSVGVVNHPFRLTGEQSNIQR